MRSPIRARTRSRATSSTGATARSDTYGTNGAKTHTYADGPDDHAITVDLVDEDGTFLDRANALSVHVNNVAPSIAISGNASVNEGSAYSLTLGRGHRPGHRHGARATSSTGATAASDTYSYERRRRAHTYADGPNDYAITVDLVDEDGTFLDRGERASRAREQRRAVDRDQRRGERERGLGLHA